MKKILIILTILVGGTLSAQETSDSLSLEQAVSIALKNNYGIVIGKLNHEQIQINNNWGNTGALPTLSGSGNLAKGYEWMDTDDSESLTSSASLNLNWVIFRGFSARITKKQLEKQESLSEGSLNLIVENTLISVIQTYYQVLLEKENLNFAEKTVQLSKDRYEQAKMKKEMGSSNSYELLLAQNTWLEDQSSYLSAKANYQLVKRQLNYLMAVPLDTAMVVSDNFEAPENNYKLKELTDRMLANNYTLKNQYLNVEMARLETKQTKSSFAPVISGNLSSGYTDYEKEYASNPMLDQNTSGWNTTASVGLTFNIYEGGTRKRALKIAEMNEEVVKTETTEKQQELKKQLAQEFDLYNINKELLKVAEENLKAAELNYKLSEEKFNVGAINSFNFRDVQQIYTNATNMYNQRVFNVIASNLALLQLTGGVVDTYQTEEKE
jgi:outer membrane protein